MHGTTFKLALSNWETWLVFTSESVTWKLVSEHEVEVRTRFRAPSSATYRAVSAVAAAERVSCEDEGSSRAAGLCRAYVIPFIPGNFDVCDVFSFFPAIVFAHCL